MEKNWRCLEKIPDVSCLVTTAVFNTQMGEVENEIPNTSGLATTAVLNAS